MFELMRPKLLAWCCLCLPLLLFSCSSPSGENRQADDSELTDDGTVHPTPENILDDSAAADVLDKSDSLSGTGRLARHARRLRGAEKTLSIGALEGNRHEVIGHVQDVAADERGNIYLLDSRLNEVRLHDPEGAFIRTFDVTGQGSEKLRAPLALHLPSRDTFVVTSRMGGVKVFARDDTSFSRRFTLSNVGPRGRCMMGNAIYASGSTSMSDSEQPNPSRRIRVYSMKGEQTASFGELYATENALLRSQMSIGPVACSASAHTLVSAFASLPMLSGYTASTSDGELRWESKIAGFKPSELTLTTRGGRPAVINDPTPASSGGESDNVASLAAAPDGHVVVQISRRTKRSLQARKPYVKLHTYLIDAAAGEGIYIGDNLPLIFDVTADHVYGGTNAPFPQVKVYQLPDGGT